MNNPVLTTDTSTCRCGCPQARHISFGCKDCPCLAFQPTGTPNEAWLLVGYELLHGETGNPHRDSPLITFESDGGEIIYASATAIARTPEQVRKQLGVATARLARLVEQFDREFALTKGEMA